MLSTPLRTTSTTDTDGTTATDSTTATRSTTGTDSITVGSRAASVSRRLRRHRGVVLRAGAGAAVLLGVTATVDSLVELGASPAPAAAAALQAGSASPAVPGSPAPRVDVVLQDVQAQSRAIKKQADAHRRELERAQARHAIAQANARARQEAQRAARRLAAQQAAARKAMAARPTPPAGQEVSRSSLRDPRSAARAMLAARGWSGQFGCLDSLWQRESNWSASASNPSSGAFGIPQALPGSKMASAGADWRTNPVTQIEWGLGYIASTYGTPCGAWAHSQSSGWY